MTDKQLIETLRNIKKYCKDRICSDCKFSIKSEVEHNFDKCCVLRNMTYALSMSPMFWDIEKIEGILNEYDNVAYILIDNLPTDVPLEELSAYVEIGNEEYTLSIESDVKLYELPHGKKHTIFDNKELTCFKNGYNTCLGDILESELYK